MGRIKELLSRLSPTKRQQAQAQLGERLAGLEKLAAAPVGSWVSDNQRAHLGAPAGGRRRRLYHLMRVSNRGIL